MGQAEGVPPFSVEMLLHSTSDFIISGMAYACKAVDIALWPNLCILSLFCHSTEKNESK